MGKMKTKILLSVLILAGIPIQALKAQMPMDNCITGVDNIRSNPTMDFSTGKIVYLNCEVDLYILPLAEVGPNTEVGAGLETREVYTSSPDDFSQYEWYLSLWGGWPAPAENTLGQFANYCMIPHPWVDMPVIFAPPAS